MKLFTCIALVVGLAFAAVSAELSGGPEYGYQIQKYLLDNGRSPLAEAQSGSYQVRTRGGVSSLAYWNVAGLPPPESLDSVSNSVAVLKAPPTHRKFSGGKWVLKTQAELDAEYAASPEGIRSGKQTAVKNSLRTELTAAGFTNQTYTLDEVQFWLETATLNAGAEKKINRLVSQLSTLSVPSVKVTP